MKKNKSLIVALVGMLVLMVVLIGAYLYVSRTTETTDKAPKTDAAESMCGDLTADGATQGTAPFAPVLKASINGTYTTSNKICEWSVNNVTDHSSYPVKGQCVFGGKTLAQKGAYTVSYKIAGQSCSKSMSVTVK